MAEQDQQQRPMERQGAEPEALALAQNQASAGEARAVVAKERTEQQNFAGHPRYNAPACRRVVEFRRPNPGERFLLAAGDGNMEGNRRACPACDAPAEAREKRGESCVGNGHHENRAHWFALPNRKTGQNQDQHREQRIERIHGWSLHCAAHCMRERSSFSRSPAI